MKLSEMFETRKALVAERDSILAQDTMSVEVEARGHEVANELGKLDAEIRAAQVRERFASSSAIENIVKRDNERSLDIRDSAKYKDQFINYLRNGTMPEQRELISTASSSILIPKIYEEMTMKYLSANSVMRSIGDLRTGVQGYQALRYSTLKTADYTSAWTEADTGSVAAAAADPLFTEVALPPVLCLPKTEVSQQLIVQSDRAFNVEEEVLSHLQVQLSKNLEFGYVGGSGTNTPTGIFKVTSTTGINITTATATSGGGNLRANSIAGVTAASGGWVGKLLEMRYTKLPAAYWNTASWIIPQDVYAVIAGTLVNNVPIFVPSSDNVATLQNAAPFTLFGLPVYVTEYIPAQITTNTTGKNCLVVLGGIRDAFAMREWGSMSVTRDEYSLSGTGRIRYQGMMFANSNHTRVNALVQLQVTNAGS
jgi:HK97 family phage major capsid protein